MTDEYLLSPETGENELSLEKSLRPQLLSQYIGQRKVKQELQIYIEAARNREEPLDHVLLYGPPGLGKTTMAMVIANEMTVNIRTTSGPAIERPGDLVAILNELEAGDVLFIDEIHRLPRVVEEMLYSAMEDFYVDIMVGQGPTAHPVHFPLPPFTLIGATTRAGMLLHLYAIDLASFHIWNIMTNRNCRRSFYVLRIFFKQRSLKKGHWKLLADREERLESRIAYSNGFVILRKFKETGKSIVL